MESDKKSNGAFIGLIIIIVILIVGAIYIWMTHNSAEKVQNTQAGSQAVSNQDANSLDALDKDIGTTDTNVSTGVNSVN